jgi:hypothetical protein
MKAFLLVLVAIAALLFAYIVWDTSVNMPKFREKCQMEQRPEAECMALWSYRGTHWNYLDE